MKGIFNLLWPPLLIFGLHILRVLLLPLRSEFDLLAHFLGGASIAWVALNLYQWARKSSRLPIIPKVVLFFFVVTVAEFVGVLWEFWEFYMLNNLFPDFQMQLPDTIYDLTLDLAGAMLFALIFVRRKKISF